MNSEWCRTWIERMKQAGLRAERQSMRPCRIHAVVLMGIVFLVGAIYLVAGLSQRYGWFDDSGGGGGGTTDHYSDTKTP